MDELIDFEELIDVNQFLSSVIDTGNSQKSSQEPLGDVLDKMCKAMSESNLDIDNVLKACKNEISETYTDDPIVDLDEFESVMAASPAHYCEDIDKINRLYNNLTNTEENIANAVPYYYSAVSTYEVPIHYEGCSHKTENDSNNLEDEKVISFLDLAVNYGTLMNPIAEVKEYNYDETIEIEDVMKNEDVTEFEHKHPEIVDFDDWRATSPTFTEDDSDDGYNSSDFEFISENEAIKAGIITRSNNIIHKPHSNLNFAIMNSAHTSRKNEASYSDYIKYSKYKYQRRCYANASSEHHVIPDGEQYLDLFRGEYSPLIINNLHILKNKCVPPAAAMAARTDELELGFDIPENQDDDEYKEDAEECAKMILLTYPGENRRKRRRF